ncbi:hypothetical protein L6452_32509 [Arctium lappa]|uniref:Uncharacterized protein n=1 Tax=Arctium lappa TaxID=4217 RepID=A0ACB8Z5P7_ARCLA|nr:hypothetical protein L6452_32509 [Arctium lappa]
MVTIIISQAGTVIPTMFVQEHDDKSCVWHATDFSDGELKDELFCIRFGSIDKVVVSPPFVFLTSVKSQLRPEIQVAVQNCWVKKGMIMVCTISWKEQSDGELAAIRHQIMITFKGIGGYKIKCAYEPVTQSNSPFEWALAAAATDDFVYVGKDDDRTSDDLDLF